MPLTFVGRAFKVSTVDTFLLIAPGGLVQKLHKLFAAHKLNACAFGVHLFRLFYFGGLFAKAFSPFLFPLAANKDLRARA